MRRLIFLNLFCGILADVSHVTHPTKDYLPPFKPDESPGYKYPEPTIQNNYQQLLPAFAPTKDIYIPPVRLPLANEVYEPQAGNSVIRPINQSPIVNSANFPPYFQTTSQDLIYPSSSKHPANNYYVQQTQNFYHPGVISNRPTRYPPVLYPPTGSIYKPVSQPIQFDRPSSSTEPTPTLSSQHVPDFATPPIATTFPTPTFRPLIFRDPTLNNYVYDSHHRRLQSR